MYTGTWVWFQTRPAGIMGQWIDTWRPRDDSDAELALFIEDDIVVSAYAYRWLRAVHRSFRHRSDFVGASLTSDEMSVLSDAPKGPLAAPDADTVLMYKCLGTWGFAPSPHHWRRFQVYLCLSRAKRLYILCWRQHSRRKLSPLTALALTTLVAQCEHNGR